MKYLLTLLLFIGVGTTMTVTESSAQVGRGAVSGAIIGGAIGDGRAISAG